MNGPAQALFLRRLAATRDGRLELRLPDGKLHVFGDPRSDLRAVVEIRDPGVFRRFVFGGDVAFGETYAEGRWTSPDLPSVVRLGVRNMRAFDAGRRVTSILSRLGHRLHHAFRRNTVSGSRFNIRFHYDLGTDFYSLFLDPTLTYSCGIFETPQTSLAQAQLAKLDRICQTLDLAPGDRLIEIGSGWGAFAMHAASRYGCRVTTTTISRSQYDYVRERLAREGLEGRVELLFEDYRKLAGLYDKAVSIEMFEAVGLSFYDRFFSTVDRLLRPGGTMLLQTIWMNEERFPSYHAQPDFIQRHIFPGGMLPSPAILKSLGADNGLAFLRERVFPQDYARTLALWRERFLASWGRLVPLGFDERFRRLWEFYLHYCEAGFRTEYIDVRQVIYRA